MEGKEIKEGKDRIGWGYVVGLGTIITFIAGIGHVNSFGLIYNDFINETHSTAKSLTSAHGVFSIMLAIGANVESGGNRPENEDLLECKENNNDSRKMKDGPKDNKLFGKIRHKFSNILNVKILKDTTYCNICIGQSFVNFSDLTFFILQPMLLFQYGYEKSQVAMCISICAGADVAGRCILALISHTYLINTRLLFYVAAILTFVIRIVMLQISQFIWMAVVTAALGVLRAWIHITSPLLIANHVSHEDFPGAYAMSMLATGCVNVTLSPVIGLLKDMYQDFIPAFYALAVCCLPCLLFWPIEYVIKTK